MTSRPWREWGTAEAGERGTGSAVVRAELPASLGSARQARVTVREALAAWGLDSLASDAELLASELVANAAEHGDGQPIALALRRVPGPRGEPGLVCEVTDTSPAMPVTGHPEPDAERGRGLSIVTALARTCGVTPGPLGKTAWFTLATPDPAAEANAEAARFTARQPSRSSDDDTDRPRSPRPVRVGRSTAATAQRPRACPRRGAGPGLRMGGRRGHRSARVR